MVTASLMRFGLVAVAAGTVVGLVMAVLALAPPAGWPGLGPTPTSTQAKFGDGLVTLSGEQLVTAAPQMYTYCM